MFVYGCATQEAPIEKASEPVVEESEPVLPAEEPEEPKDVVSETNDMPTEPAAKAWSFSWEKDNGSRDMG